VKRFAFDESRFMAAHGGRKWAGKSKQLLALRLKRMGKMPVVGGKCWKQKVQAILSLRGKLQRGKGK